MLLGGYPPFYDKNEQKMFLKIEEGEYDFQDPVWADVSERCMANETNSNSRIPMSAFIYLRYRHNRIKCCVLYGSIAFISLYLRLL